MITGIYKIENIINGKCYIGSAHNITKRWCNHKHLLRLNKHHSIILQNAWNKYGESNFVFAVVYECGINTLIQKEQEYIDVIHPYYNIRKIASSQLGIKRSDEARKKMSDAQRGKRRKARSDDTKRKISEALKGKPKSENHKAQLSIVKKGKPAHNKGVKHTDKTKELISQSQKARHIRNMLDIYTSRLQERDNETK